MPLGYGKIMGLENQSAKKSVPTFWNFVLNHENVAMKPIQHVLFL